MSLTFDKMTLTIKKAQLTAVVICGNRGDTDQRPMEHNIYLDRWQGPPQSKTE